VSPVRSEAVARGVVLLHVSTHPNHPRERTTYANAVVPESNIPLIPLKPNLHLGTRRYNLIEKTNDMVALRLRHADDLGDKAGVEEQRLPTSNRVSTDERVGSGDGLTANSATHLARALRLELSRVDGGERLKILLHVGREHVVGGILGGPEGVAAAAAGWAAKNFE
jgi:hypothetical protein